MKLVVKNDTYSFTPENDHERDILEREMFQKWCANEVKARKSALLNHIDELPDEVKAEIWRLVNSNQPGPLMAPKLAETAPSVV